MKKDNIVIYFSELLLLIYIIIFKIFIQKIIPNYIDLSNLLFFGILCFSTYKLLGFSKKRASLNYNAGQLITITIIIYYVSIYLFGLFFGFLKNSYSLTLTSIVRNTVPVIIMYILKEIYRYIIVSKKNNKSFLPMLVVTLLLAFLDIIMEINGYDLSSTRGITEMIGALILPKLAISALLSYIAYNFSYKLAIVFLVLIDLPKYFLPLLPDLGMYVSSILTLVLVFVIYYQLSLIREKYERKLPLTKTKTNKLKIGVLLAILLMFVGLVSGLFKYHLFAIASNSMIPVFERGDAVLIEKIKKEEMNELKEDDILAFYYNNQVIVHRIMSIKNTNGELLIKTKGDNNEIPDGWTVNNDMIYGKVIGVVRYIGIPSVELSELMN